jgi:geranylgeranyl diphosphate synthase type I
MALAATATTADVEFKDRIDARLAQVFGGEVRRWGRYGQELADTISVLGELCLGGGKRLRPALAYWAFVGAGGSPDAGIILDAATALELIHVAALVHDDVIDGAWLRRGRTTVHERFAARHREERLRGEARRFGDGIAVLVGDLALFLVDRLVVSAPASARELLAELRIEMTMGQLLDVFATAHGVLDAATAQLVAHLKAAKYSVERPLHLGAALADRLPELQAELSAFGLPLGQAFQYQDDLLGVFGEESSVGKRAADDLRQGRCSLLFAVAVRRAGAGDRKRLSRIGSSDLTDLEVADLKRLLVDLGARQEVERVINELVGRALSALQQSRLTGEARRALEELALFVASRPG